MSLYGHPRPQAPYAAGLADRDRFGFQPPPRNAVAPPSRSSTCFSALTMTSSDDHIFEETQDGVEQDGFGLELSFSSDDDDADSSPAASATALSLIQEESIPELSFDTEDSEAESAPNSADASESDDSEPDSLTLDDFGCEQDDLGRGPFGTEISSEMSWLEREADQGLPRHARSQDRPAQPDDGQLVIAASSSRASSPPAKRRKTRSYNFSEDEMGSRADATQHVDVAAPSKTTPFAPRSPTQAEMDAFFGFVDPLAPSSAVRAFEGEIGQESQGEPADPSATMEPVRVATLAKPATTRRSKHRRTEPREDETSHQNVLPKRYYQLEPIPSTSPDTGRALTDAEKRQVGRTVGIVSGRESLTWVAKTGATSLPRSSGSHFPSYSRSPIMSCRRPVPD